MPIAITVENLSKRYLINHRNRNAHPDLRETITNWVRTPFHKLRHGAAHSLHTEEFWALKDVSFEVQEGEVLGVIGRNGAGKSTLLKILSRITEPTSGRVTIRGRVSSLLEVGTGFNPEFSGRENVYLNGSILGMSKREIDARFDEIVDFSGVEKFIDTPTKRYSSGMQVRLAFAVAAHLQPEVLIIDEVLAVGDAEFQKKCLGKMESVSQGGRTVIFVSHNMAAVESLCQRVAALKGGQVSFLGDTRDVISSYLRSFRREADELDLSDPALSREGDGRARVVDFGVYASDGTPGSTLRMGEGVTFRLRIRGSETLPRADIIVALFNSRGQRVAYLASREMQTSVISFRQGEEFLVECKVPRLNLLADNYTLNVGIVDMTTHEIVDRVENVGRFGIVPADVFGTSYPPKYGIAFYPGQWSFEKTNGTPAPNSRG